MSKRKRTAAEPDAAPADAAPEVSLIIPVYNVAAELPRCLNACLGQSLRNIELIVIDDGAEDDSGRICDDYAARDSRIRVIHQANQGVSAARNAGMDIARGTWLGFVDGDDFISRRFCELLSRCGRSGGEIVHGTTVLEGFGPQPITDREPNELIRRHASPLYFVNGWWAALYRREYVERRRLRFDPLLSHGEDLLFLMQALAPGPRLLQEDGAEYHYCRRPGSADAGSAGHEERAIASYERSFGTLQQVLYRVQNRFDPDSLGYVWSQLLLRLHHSVARRAADPRLQQRCRDLEERLSQACPPASRPALEKWLAEDVRRREAMAKTSQAAGRRPGGGPPPGR